MTALPYIPVATAVLGEEEEAAVLAVMRSGRLAQGPRVEAFEHALAGISGTRHGIATSSGTAALFLVLKALGVGPGDEVITSSLSFIATANAIAQTGARPVFADVDESLNLAPAAAEALITPRTRVIMPVHLHGNPCDMRTLSEVARRRGLALVQDACQAIGATIDGEPLGSFGTAVYSFYATKNITTGEGGAIVTDDDAVMRLTRSWRHQAYSEHAPYVHDAIGYNFRMTEIQAAIGVCQLSKLDAITRARRDNAKFFDAHVDDRYFLRPVVLPGSRHVYHQYVVRVDASCPVTRDEVREGLSAEGVGSAVHYPMPLHLQPPYRDAGAAHCPAAERATRDMLSLPVHPTLTAAERERIVEAVAAQLEEAA